jgi:hypothetical protein
VPVNPGAYEFAEPEDLVGDDFSQPDSYLDCFGDVKRPSPSAWRWRANERREVAVARVAIA